MRSPSHRHMPALDGLRGLAIIGVMALHYREVLVLPNGWQKFLSNVCSYGYLGVDLFFVLSGFLITGILIDSRASHREVGPKHYFGVFYWRRILRIFPAYYAFLLLVAAIEIIASHLKGALTWYPNYWWYIGYLQNLQPSFGQHDGFLNHLWSLAVEEQFYLFWPLFVWLCPPRRLAWACVAMAAFSLSVRCIYFHQISLDATWRMTPFRLDSLGLGALMAVWYRDPRIKRVLMERGGWWVIAGGAFLWFVIVQPVGFPVAATAFTAAALFFAVTLFRAAHSEPRWLRVTWLRHVGKYSYGMYLIHLVLHSFINKPALALLARLPVLLAGFLRVAYIPAMMFAVFVLAHVWWKAIEEPFLKRKDRFRYDPPADAQPSSEISYAGVSPAES